MSKPETIKDILMHNLEKIVNIAQNSKVMEKFEEMLFERKDNNLLTEENKENEEVEEIIKSIDS